ncbi:7-cyano-7-deazaguanine synthase QueC [Erythrobacter ani]|uniref:7-cyano-7-deazaguanine synthase n=1 Tax=Erythrobacter ani TaxID=2827235 RepID=A0ABS6SLC8_9SPHN|nr:7-cyano-7-deazaguanine synthase QueC [Erythrobacter ani]MBV7265786.1 7-cyano-7-deazaguanine synthase QueC [Erythrobacter ani]
MTHTSSNKAASKTAIVLLSGGLDSMVTTAIAKEQGFAVRALSVDYGQRHRLELASAKRIADKLSLADHIEIALDLRAFGGSALTDAIAVPKSGVGETIPVTYVPARNLVFLALTTACAEAAGSSDVFIGVNALDYSGYPDCRPEFIASYAETARLGTRAGVEGSPFTVHTPLQHMTKADIARECDRLGLDPAWSWSCYDPGTGDIACGLCDSCRLRKKGFAEAGITDSTVYAA